MKKRVIVFGIFDGVHEGHRSLFAQALRSVPQGQAVRGSEEPSGSRRGKAKEDVELIVIVGRDSASLKWKGKKPKHSEETRRNLVSKERGVGQALLGDEEQSSYKVLENLHPDVVCLGYDQDVLAQDLRLWLKKMGREIPIYILKPHDPHINHTSFLS